MDIGTENCEKIKQVTHLRVVKEACNSRDQYFHDE